MPIHNCQCGSCQQKPEDRSLRERIIAEVHEGQNYWSAFDQGRLAFADGKSESDNAFHMMPCHVANWDWLRGFRLERDAHQAP